MRHVGQTFHADVFKNLGDQWENQTIEKTKILLHTLKELDEFEDDDF